MEAHVVCDRAGMQARLVQCQELRRQYRTASKRKREVLRGLMAEVQIPLRQVWVDPAWRRQGLGTQLLELAEQEARRRGCRQIVLTTFTFQAPAFYARHGYEVVAQVDDYPRGHGSLLMRKRLEPGD